MNFIAAGLVLLCAGVVYMLRHQIAVAEARKRAYHHLQARHIQLLDDHDEATSENETLRWQLEASDFMLLTVINEANLGHDFKIPLPQTERRKDLVEKTLEYIEAVQPADLENNPFVQRESELQNASTPEEFVEIFSDHCTEPIMVLASGPVPKQRDAGNGQAYFKDAS